MIKYCIIPTVSLDSVIIDRSQSTNIFTIRKNKDGSMAILKFKINNVPFNLAGLDIQLLNKKEILLILKNPGWNNI